MTIERENEMELSREKATKAKAVTLWNTDIPMAYQIEGNTFEFYPYSWLSNVKGADKKSDRDRFGIKGDKPARELLKIVVANGLSLGMFSYTIHGVWGEKRELSVEETKAQYESNEFDVKLIVKYASGKPKGHFLFVPKKKPAKKVAAKKPAAKKPAARTLKGL